MAGLGGVSRLGGAPVQEIMMRVTTSRRFRRCRKGRHCRGEFPAFDM